MILSHGEMLAERVRDAVEHGAWEDMLRWAAALHEHETTRRGRRSAVCQHEGDHTHHLLLRWEHHDDRPPTPHQVAVWDVWFGGFAEIALWPWNAEGLVHAQDWCDRYGAVWHVSGAVVRAAELAVHDLARYVQE